MKLLKVNINRKDNANKLDNSKCWCSGGGQAMLCALE